MAEANRAYEAGDEEALRRILDEYHDGADAVEGEGIGAELIRIIRQISQAKERIAAIEQESETLLTSEIAKLRRDTEEAEHKGRDLLAELAATVREQIELAKGEHEAIARRIGERA
jgi:seryl-tRNA synthetase